ncbi:DUF2939 domain-containing protein [Thioalkalicoccus limnaeus]|uniref:DUF2939 domain-containing protein n=1 Tax=Thioalkalicoccus limnaeus TaxID=120681 RepID=A0ABV4BDN5_9GAMM
MMRLFASLLLFALIGYGLWPYYHILQMDTALSRDDPAALEPLVDLQAIQRNYKQRLTTGLGLPRPQEGNDALGRLSQGLARLGDATLEQLITPTWVQHRLREATRAATERDPPYLISGIRFAFFESPNRFLIRIGELGGGATHIRMDRQGATWRVTDIID